MAAPTHLNEEEPQMGLNLFTQNQKIKLRVISPDEYRQDQ